MEREPEPRRARPVGVLVREDADPDGGGHDRGDRDRPGRVEWLVEERAAPVELAAEREEREEDDAEDDRLLVVEPLHERRDDTRAEEAEDEQPGAVEAAREPAREDEEPGADDAADEVRRLE